MSERWLGIDVGTQSVRAMLVTSDGETVGAGRASIASERTDGRHEQSPDEWWTATVAAVSMAMKGRGDRSVRAVAVSATSGTILITDEAGEPRSMGIMYDDSRGATTVDKVNEIGGATWDRLGYRHQGSWALPKLVAMIDAGAVPAGSRVLTQADFISNRLAGRVLASDVSHSLKSGVDLDSVEWPSAVFDALGVDPAMFPGVESSGEVIGNVSSSASEVTGLPTGCAIVAGMTDGCAAQIAAGALTPGSWNSVLGTTLVLKGASLERRPDPSGVIYAHRAPFDSGWYPGGASSIGAGAVSAWLAGRDLTELSAGELTPRAAYPLVGTGERFPFVAPTAKAFFASGSSIPDSDAEIFESIIFGVAFVERLAFETLSARGYDIDGTISFTGGGARNDRWNAIRATVLQRDIRVPAEAEGALGMAVLASAALDEHSPPTEKLGVAAQRMLGDSETVIAPAVDPDIEDAYGEFRATIVDRGWL